jgi:hypothetical protein
MARGDVCRFLDDGLLEIDNYIAERALRGIAVERRNWLFAGSKTGGGALQRSTPSPDLQGQWRRPAGLHR